VRVFGIEGVQDGTRERERLDDHACPLPAARAVHRLADDPASRAKAARMIDLLETVERWRAGGSRVALATVVAVERSAPRDPGAMLAVNDRGEIAGSVSGGCVESAVYEEARDAIATGRPRLIAYGISDDDAISVGLTCGGTIHVFIERLDW